MDKENYSGVELDMGLIYEYARTMETLLKDQDYENLSSCIDHVKEIAFNYNDGVFSMLECLGVRKLDVTNKEVNNVTKEEKDKICELLTGDRNEYARDCQRRIAEESGKIRGADYMLERFFDILKTEVEPQESEDGEQND